MSSFDSTDADYVLGRSTAEQRRLVEQAAFLRPSTERIFRAAGIGSGMRVLDVGCGVGDVSFLSRSWSALRGLSLESTSTPMPLLSPNSVAP